MAAVQSAALDEVVIQSIETADPEAPVMVYSNPESDVTVLWSSGSSRPASRGARRPPSGPRPSQRPDPRQLLLRLGRLLPSRELVDQELEAGLGERKRPSSASARASL